MELRAGDRIDRFTLQELLGEGGQGSVWRASDPLHAEAPRALKLVPMAMARGSALERVRREAHALSRLDHPSLVACDGLFEDLKRGVLGLVMGFVKGVSLAEAQLDPRFGDGHAGAVLKHLADALAYLHGRGVVHRDLKQDNVLITDQFFEDPAEAKHVVLVDLGIAIETDPSTRLTQEGGLVGTLSYLAPEALDPANFEGGTASPTVDVFAFGVLATRVLTGSHPTGLPPSSTPFVFAEAYRKAKTDGALQAPGVTGPWARLIEDALRVDPAQRIADGAELSLRVREAGPATRAATAGRRNAEEQPSLPAERSEAESAPPSVEGANARESTAAAYAASSASPASSPATPKRQGGWIVGTAALLGLAGGALYYANVTFNGTPPAPAIRSASVPKSLPTPEISAAPVASVAEPDAEKMTLPQGCNSVCACCPSGRDCGPQGCAGLLLEDARVVLRLASAQDTAGKSLTAEARVCLSLGEDATARTCFPAQRDPGEVEAGGLDVSVADLTSGRVELNVEQRMDIDAAMEVWSPMASGKLELAAPLQGSLFCRGIEVPPLTGHVPVGRVRLFLDPADAPAPERCP